MRRILLPERLEKILLNFNSNAVHKKITFNTDGKLVFLESDEILYAESDGKLQYYLPYRWSKNCINKKIKRSKRTFARRFFF